MRYQVELTIPANTSISDLVAEDLLLPLGILNEVEIIFPWGCAGLAHIRILHNEHQLYPTTLEKWFNGNEILIEFPCEYDLPEAWNSISVEGYNEDDSYPHTPVVSFTVLPVRGSWLDVPRIVGVT
ncbi:MAG: hypothetical protein KKB38_20255 [Gammaproteobacteria bacterium]|nr:hypothetical protein [Gammaproteobacteria bacterium]